MPIMATIALRDRLNFLTSSSDHDTDEYSRPPVVRKILDGFLSLWGSFLAPLRTRSGLREVANDQACAAAVSLAPDRGCEANLRTVERTMRNAHPDAEVAVTSFGQRRRGRRRNSGPPVSSEGTGQYVVAKHM
jgi:hypothetical protein